MINLHRFNRYVPALINTGAVLTMVLFNAGFIVDNVLANPYQIERWIFITAASIPLMLCLLVLRSALIYPRVAATVICGAFFVLLSQGIYFAETSAAFREVMVIGPEGAYYFKNLDDMFFNMGLCMVLAGLLHSLFLAAQNRRRLQRETIKKESALIESQLITHQLQERERELRQVLDTVPHMIFARNREGVILLANKAYADAYDTTVEEIVGRVHRSEYSKHEFDSPFDRVPDHAKTGQPLPYEEHTVTIKGEPRQIQTIKIPYISNRVDSQAVLGVALDITSQKKAEEELQKRIELEMLVASISTRFVNLAPEKTESEINLALRRVGKVLDVDRAFISFHEPEFKNVAHFEWCAAGIPSFVNATLNVPVDKFTWAVRRFEAGHSIVINDLDEFPPEAQYERRWHEWQLCRAVITVPIITGKLFRGYVGLDSVKSTRVWPPNYEPFLRLVGEVLWNAWSRMTYERQRDALERQIRYSQKLESLGVMASGVAHDFNNLLLCVLGNVDLIRLRNLVLPEAEHNLRNVEQAARQAADLCRQMLAMAGKGQVVIEPIHLGMLAQEMQSLLSVSLPRNVSLQCEVAPHLKLMEGDASQIRQILLNLIANAAESMQGQAGSVRVRLADCECTAKDFASTVVGSALPAGMYVKVEVEDSGAGMSEDTMKRIFDPFYSTKAPGRGLGLAAVLGIVRGHQGALKLSSSPGAGTIFTTYFPVIRGKRVRPLLRPPDLEGWRGSGLLLLLDDKEYILSVCTGMLERLGYGVVSAQTLPEALELLQTEKEIRGALVDGAILGVESAARLEEMHKLLAGRPMVVSSGYGRDNLAQALPPEFFGAYIQKPFQFSELRQVFFQVFGAGPEPEDAVAKSATV
ncbi:MAG: PAS domain S-box protein [Candidatus Hydrogenedentes bacterium]|nr:PAS domain S-box protein [Candidatus Hydrogenedentota bacterium]